MNNKTKKILNSYEMSKQVEEATNKFRLVLNFSQGTYLGYLIEINKDLEAFDNGCLTADGLKEFNWLLEQLHTLATDLHL